jgi:hypothetical protein
MAEALTLSSRRLVTPVVAVVFAAAMLAALALGFGIRAWTEHTPRPATPVVVQHASSLPQEQCRLGRAC